MHYLKLILSLSLILLVPTLRADEKSQSQVTFSGFPAGSTVFIDNYDKTFLEGTAVDFDIIGLKPNIKYLVEVGYIEPNTQVKRSTLLHIKADRGQRVTINEMSQGMPSQSANFDRNETQKNLLPNDAIVTFTERKNIVPVSYPANGVQSRIQLFNLPNYNCDVYFNTTDHMTTKGERTKSYSTPPLEPGKYYYDIYVQFNTANGQRVSLYRRINFTPGQNFQLDVNQFEAKEANFQTSFETSVATIKFEVTDRSRISINGELINVQNARGEYISGPVSRTETKLYKIEIAFLDHQSQPRVYSRTVSLKGGDKITLYMN